MTVWGFLWVSCKCSGIRYWCLHNLVSTLKTTELHILKGEFMIYKLHLFSIVYKREIDRNHWMLYNITVALVGLTSSFPKERQKENLTQEAAAAVLRAVDANRGAPSAGCQERHSPWCLWYNTPHEDDSLPKGSIHQV